MPVKTVPPKYEASDGKEFKTKAKAERHDALTTAKQKYTTARREFGKVLAQTQRTADGEPFSFDSWQRYYYVTEGYFRMPELNEVRFHGWNFEFDDSDSFVIRQEEGHDFRDKRWVEYKISDLYVDKGKAEKALLKAQEERLAELAQQVAEFRAKINSVK